MMYPIGMQVPMNDGAWTITARGLVTTVAAQVEVYTLARGGHEIRMTRSEVDANRMTH